MFGKLGRVSAALLLLSLCSTTAPAQSKPAAKKPAPAQPAAPPPRKLQPDEVAFTGEGKEISVAATIKQGKFSSLDATMPSWTVTMTFRNPTANDVELGESLIVLEAAQFSPIYVGCYVTRKRESDVPALKNLKDRYLLSWGYDVASDGTYLSSMVRGSRVVAVYGGHEKVFDTLGFGRVSPHAERRISADLPFPVSPKDGKSVSVAAILPAVRPPKTPARHFLARFYVENSKYGDEIQAVETTSVVSTVDALRAEVTDWSLSTWRRAAALNWLAEEHRDAASPLLLQYASTADVTASATVLRHVSVVNLGTWQVKAAVPPLLEIAQKSDDAILRRAAVQALGSISDVAAAPVIRPYITHADDALGAAAIEAAGKLKDAESVPAILSVLSDYSKMKRHSEAAAALAAIGNRAAVDGLIGIAQDAKRTEAVRKIVFAQLGKIGGPGPVATLTAATASTSNEISEAAIDALLQTKDSAATATVIALAGRSAYPWRGAAIRQLGLKKIAEALPVLRSTASDRLAPAETRMQACRALAALSDKPAKDALLSAADDGDVDLYLTALEALDTIYEGKAGPIFVAALKSVHPFVRRQAASLIQRRKLGDAAEPLWQAYQTESDEPAAQAMALALAELKFSSRTAVALLIGRLDPMKNGLWFQDVVLLRQITGQTFGPQDKYVDGKVRDAELTKWKTWWAGKEPPPSR